MHDRFKCIDCTDIMPIAASDTRVLREVKGTLNRIPGSRFIFAFKYHYSLLHPVQAAFCPIPTEFIKRSVFAASVDVMA